MKSELQKPDIDLFSQLIGILNVLSAGQWFDGIVISSCAGHAKPDRRIFAAALARHGLEANNAAHIGDSEERIFAAPNDAGLMGILVYRNGESPSAAGPRVTDLGEILPLLGD